MPVYNIKDTRSLDERDRIWLQFQCACAELLARPLSQRGPYVISDDDIFAAMEDLHMVSLIGAKDAAWTDG